MQKNSTKLNLLNHFSQIKIKKSVILSNEKFKVNNYVIENIISYSKSLKCIKTVTIGDVLIVNN